MPEGPQVARFARMQAARLAGRAVRVDSPNGRSDEVAELLDGATLRGVEAIGKHLLYDFGDDRYLHVHLGRFGKFTEGPMPLPEVRGILRLRLSTDEHWYELRGAIAIEIFDAERRTLLEGRIGPNPLAADADRDAIYRRIARSKGPIGLLLMDQSIVAGVGNIYRAESLFLTGLNPRRPGTAVPETAWDGLWREFVRMMADGARIGRIVSTYPADREKPTGTARASDRFYVYHRDGLPCRACGTAIRVEMLGSRKVWWCPSCQPDDPAREPAPPAGVGPPAGSRALAAGRPRRKAARGKGAAPAAPAAPAAAPVRAVRKKAAPKA